MTIHKMVRPFATDTLAAAARAVCSDARTAGVLRAMMSVLLTEALICYRVEVDERARRVRTAAGRLSSPDVLELLLDLPIGWPVPITSLTRRERDALGSAAGLTAGGGRFLRVSG
jgi:hypothetical protein